MSKKDKNITLLTSYLGGGGAENVCVSVANGLAKRGWTINLVVLHSDNANYASRLSSSVNLIELGVRHTRHALLPFKRFLSEYKPKKLLAFNYEMTLLSLLVRIFLRQKFTLIARNINTMSQKMNEPRKVNFWRRNIISPLSRRLYHKIDYSINQCFAMEADLLLLYPQLKGRTCVIYNPIAEHIENYNHGKNVDKEDYFLCIGRLENQKNFSHAIKAFSIFCKTSPNYILKIIGEGSQLSLLKDLTINLGLENNIHFLGFKEDVIPYYLKAKAIILSSNYEGFPNVLLESIALGTPIISYNCPSGPSEIIQDGINGFLVDHLNINALSDAIKRSESYTFDPIQIIQTSKKFRNDEIIKEYERILLSIK